MGAGRPSKFSASVALKMIELYQTGKTDVQVAEIIGVDESTITRWKSSKPELFMSIREAKLLADEISERSLFAIANGYSHPETVISFDKHGNECRATRIKHYPPDVNALKWWLKNRQPDKWRDTAVVLTPETKQTGSLKKSFEQFCLDAGYPKPYPKQIEMKDFCFREDGPRLLLGARGYGKTDYDTILGTAYDIYENGTDTSNLIVSKSKTRNAAMIQEIANALKANGVQLDVENSTCLRVAGLIGKEHSAEALTIKSSFRGRHPKRLLMDDPVTEEDTSAATRELVKRKYDEAYKLCKNIVIIGQPAHALDLYAELRPALRKMEVPHGTIPELDADLEAMTLAGVDQMSIEMSYHLKVPTGLSMPFGQIKYLEQPFGNAASVAFLDPSHEGRDHSALSIVRGYMQGVAVVGFTWKKAWNHCLDDMVPLLKQFGVKKICIETNGIGDMAVGILRDVFGPFGIGVVGRRSNNNKHSRIIAAGAFAHMIHLSRESSKSYTDQVVKYDYKSEPDDGPDSLATCLEWIGLTRGKQ